MDVGSGDFDLQAAWARRADSDGRAFAEALAVRLEAALPGLVAVERGRDGLFASTRHVTRIALAFDTVALTLEVDGGRLRGRRAKVVRGVTLRSEDMTVPAWIAEVVRHTRMLGDRADAAHTALHEFLMF